MKIIVTIPAFNEEKTIARMVTDVKRAMDGQNYGILVVDDGSKDNTAATAREAGATVVSHPINYGLAETFRTEVQTCLEHGADIIVHVDADGQYRADEIPRLIKEIEKGYDLVLGSRFRGHIESMSIINRWGNKAFSKVISRITRMNITDGQTGFRAFTRQVAKELKIISTHTYTQEQIIKATKQKFRIKEVPISFMKRKEGKSRLIKGPFEYAIKAWLNILRIYRDYEPMKFFGIIGGIFLLSSGIIGLWFVYLHFTVGIKGHLGMLILMLLLFMSGIQISIFGFLADMNKNGSF